MSTSTSIRINQELYELARQDAVLEQRTIAEQIEFWARVGRAALAHPALVAQAAFDHLEDVEDAQTVRERANGPFVEVSLDQAEFSAAAESNQTPDEIAAAIASMRQFKCIQGVDNEEVMRWIAEGRL
jgi:hypothetical protein